jgi:hypothetical protein
MDSQSRADGEIVDALDNDEINVDFKPLYQCIHIYEALESKPELQRSFQEDRKVSALITHCPQSGHIR